MNVIDVTFNDNFSTPLTERKIQLTKSKNSGPRLSGFESQLYSLPSCVNLGKLLDLSVLTASTVKWE